MLISENLTELKDEVIDGVAALFNSAEANQTHPQDLLLVDQHGFFDSSLAGSRSNLDGYVIGTAEIGFAEWTLYEFVDWYRHSHQIDRESFDKRVVEEPDLAKHDSLMVQLEMSLYLRLWEADSIIKQYYNLTRLACGEHYDWHVAIPGYSRGGSKQDFIRKEIRDKLSNVCRPFHDLVKRNFNTQVRNAIAHSQFYFIDRSIFFLNHSTDQKAHAPLKGMSFDDWYRKIHTTILLHSEMIGGFAKARAAYREKTLKQGNKIEIRVTRPDVTTRLAHFGVMHNREDWIWHGNLSEEDLKLARK